jgi:hypothetical protein
LADQFEILQNKTLHPTIVELDIGGSHVQAFGDLSIQKEFLSEFMGKGKTRTNNSKNVGTSISNLDLDVYPTRDIPLLMLAQQQKNGIENNMKMQVLLEVKYFVYC